MLALFEELGLAVIRFFEYLGGLVYLFLETVSWISKGSLRTSLTVNQMALLGVSSLGIVVVHVLFCRHGAGTAVVRLRSPLRRAEVRRGEAWPWPCRVSFAPMLTAVGRGRSRRIRHHR